MEMSINGNIVRLTTTYSQTGITISTSGINADVLKYLRNTYNDGLTFEITSYFNTKRVDANGNTVAVTRESYRLCSTAQPSRSPIHQRSTSMPSACLRIRRPLILTTAS